MREAAGFGAAGAFPPAGETDAALVERGRSVLAELERRVAQAQGAATPAEAVRSVFGNGFVFLPRFRPAAPATLAQALAAESELAVARWLEGAARVRAGLGRWRLLSILAGALGSTPARFDVAQLPFVAGERWVGLSFDGEARPPSGRLSLVVHRPSAVSADDDWAGLVLDQWTELVPGASELTAAAVNYDSPNTQAPQAMLLAVPAVEGGVNGRWDLDTLVDTLQETLDLAKVRAVDGELLGALGQLLPAIYLSTNTRDETISTDLRPLLVADPVVAP